METIVGLSLTGGCHVARVPAAVSAGATVGHRRINRRMQVVTAVRQSTLTEMAEKYYGPMSPMPRAVLGKSHQAWSVCTWSNSDDRSLELVLSDSCPSKDWETSRVHKGLEKAIGQLNASKKFEVTGRRA